MDEYSYIESWCVLNKMVTRDVIEVTYKKNIRNKFSYGLGRYFFNDSIKEWELVYSRGLKKWPKNLTEKDLMAIKLKIWKVDDIK